MTLLVLALTACASLKNTPRQDYTWEMGRACETEVGGGIQMTRVEPDGRYWFIGGPAEWRWFRDCMSRKFQATPYRQWLEQHKAEYEGRR